MPNSRLVAQLKEYGLTPSKLQVNLSVSKLVELAIQRNEGMFSSSGAFCVKTGRFTGRSPDDRYIVDDDLTHNTVNWGKINHPISEEIFNVLYERIKNYIKEREVFIFEGTVGADKKFQIPLKVITDTAWQCVFSNIMFIKNDNVHVNSKAGFTLISVSNFVDFPEIGQKNLDTFIIIDLKQKIVLIGGTSYAGEIKKAMFSIMNFILPVMNVMPMHCSANIGKDGNVAVFFGLSGTGKTTLSADPNRYLIGDDEHGWSENGVFNFEGGCYAKCIDLKKEKEPQIWNAIKFGALMENVTIDSHTREPDFTDRTTTENTRVAYPLSHISDVLLPSIAGHPNVIIFLTADAFGVLPPVSKLSPESAMYHFMSGYTSKLAGTERGITEPKEVFSECFGAPFMPRHTSTYARMLGEKIRRHGTKVYLVNTGWTGGSYGVGKRIDLKHTRAIVSAILDDSIEQSKFRKDGIFNLEIPDSCPSVPSEILCPANTWQDKKDYEKHAKKLARMFVKNFEKFGKSDESIVRAGPKNQEQ